MIKVLIADDQQLFRELLEHMLTNNEEITVVASARSGQEAIALAREHRPDLILMDIQMPDGNGIEATREIKAARLHSRVIVLTSSHDDEDVAEALDAGADGYLLKSVGKDELVLAIKSVNSGMEVIHQDVRQQARRGKRPAGDDKKTVTVNGIEVELSARELKIIQMIVDGKDTAQMATALFLAEGRVRNIITEILSKLMVKDRTGLAVFAIKHKLAE